MRSIRQHGFSLIEILAVIFIIGLSLGMVGLSVNRSGAKDDVWEAVEQFIGIAQAAGERAILTGETMGLLLEPPHWQAQRGEDVREIGWRYRWVTSSSEGWQPVSNLPPVSLPPTVKLLIEVDELIWDPADQIDRTTPVAAYYSSGDITPIRIEISDERETGFTQNIEVDENGELVWREAPEMPEVAEGAF